MKFITIEYDNNRLTNAQLSGHREIIAEQVEKGYEYVGFIPVKLGPSGKMLAIDLVFKSK